MLLRLPPCSSLHFFPVSRVWLGLGSRLIWRGLSGSFTSLSPLSPVPPVPLTIFVTPSVSCSQAYHLLSLEEVLSCDSPPPPLASSLPHLPVCPAWTPRPTPLVTLPPTPQTPRPCCPSCSSSVWTSQSASHLGEGLTQADGGPGAGSGLRLEPDPPCCPARCADRTGSRSTAALSGLLRCPWASPPAPH